MLQAFKRRLMRYLTFVLLTLSFVTAAQSPTITPINNIRHFKDSPRCDTFPSGDIQDIDLLRERTNHVLAYSSFPNVERSIEENIDSIPWVLTFEDEFDSLPSLSTWKLGRSDPAPFNKIDQQLSEGCDALMYYNDDGFEVAPLSPTNNYLKMILKKKTGFYPSVADSFARSTDCGVAGALIQYEYEYEGAALTGTGSLSRTVDGTRLKVNNLPWIDPFVGHMILEARVRVPNDPGAWSAFWSNTGNEIDIFEFFGTSTSYTNENCENGDPTDDCSSSVFLSNNYSRKREGRNCGISYRFKDGGGDIVDFSEEFHIYTLELTPLYLRVYIDGLLFRSEGRFKRSNGDILGLDVSVEDVDDEVIYENLAFPVSMTNARLFRIQFTSSVEKNMHNSGHISPSLNTSMDVDYVRVFMKTFNQRNHDCYVEINHHCSGAEESEFVIDEISRGGDFSLQGQIDTIIWSHSPNIEIVSESNTGVTVKKKIPFIPGQMWVTADVDFDKSLDGLLAADDSEGCTSFSTKKIIHEYEMNDNFSGTITVDGGGESVLMDTVNNLVSGCTFEVEFDLAHSYLIRSSSGLELLAKPPHTNYTYDSGSGQLFVSNLLPGEEIAFRYKFEDANKFKCSLEGELVFENSLESFPQVLGITFSGNNSDSLVLAQNGANFVTTNSMQVYYNFGKDIIVKDVRQIAGSDKVSWSSSSSNNHNVLYINQISDFQSILLEYTVIYPSGCESTFRVAFVKQKGGNGYKYSVYPNPVNDDLSLVSSLEVYSETQYEILSDHHLGRNLSGKLNFAETKHDINVTELPAGTYYIRIVAQGDQQPQFVKFVKQ